MADLDYIEQLGIGVDQSDSDTETTDEQPEESQEDLSLDSEVSTSEKENTNDTTEINGELLKSLQSQIEGMEKRIADKDAFISELREQSKAQSNVEEKQGDTQEEEGDFWDDPDKTIAQLKKTIQEQAEQQKMQAMQTQEIIYANGKKDYWDVVNNKAMQEAAALDPDFLQNVQSSQEPYKVAYEYLTKKNETTQKSQSDLVEQEVQKRLKEMGVTRDKKDVPPTINGGSKSESSRDKSPEDGFAAVFGSSY